MQVTAGNWHTVKDRVLEIERRSFVPSIQEDDRSLTKMAQSQSAIFLVALVASDAVAGYAMADVLENFGDVPGTRKDIHFGRRDTIYISSVAVDQKWRGRGIGVGLEREIITIAHERGYQRITAHIRSSARLDGHLSREVLGTFSNWYQTGFPFDYVVLDLRNADVRAHG